MAAKALVPVRFPNELLAKLDVVAKANRRKRSEMVRLLVEDAVAAYEAAHGPIVLPAAHPAPGAGSGGAG